MTTPEVFQLQAEFCQRMSNASRLQVLNALRSGPSCVSDIAATTGIAPSAVSRHLAVLRGGGLVAAERKGQEVFYAIVNPKVAEICDLMRSVLAEQLRLRASVAEAFESDLSQPH